MSEPKNAYDEQFFHGLSEPAGSAAEVIVPALLELFAVASVVDVGCGTGEWLKAFSGHGVATLAGVDAFSVAYARKLVPPAELFRLDLEEPIRLARTYDLAVCLEVAEHLPAASADSLVESLAGLAPLVLFSAAIPGQEGTHHLNEQWPAYWAERFRARGFRALDSWRLRWWRHPQVKWWYSQNMVIYVREDWQGVHCRAQPWPAFEEVRALIHPELYLRKCEELKEATTHTVRSTGREFRRALARHLKRRLARWGL